MFFAAYVTAVPVLLSLADRFPARRVHLVGTGLTALSHLGFAFVADDFWSCLVMRALAGVGWAGAHMVGLKAIADPLEGAAQSRAVSWHAAGAAIAVDGPVQVRPAATGLDAGSIGLQVSRAFHPCHDGAGGVPG